MVETITRAQYGSDIVADLMRAFGIRYFVINPGSTFKWIHDSVVNYGGNRNPEIIECLHEEIAIAVAHGYAKATGTPVAASVHNVVGLAHGSMAIYNAWADRAPVIVMGGTGPMDLTTRRAGDWPHTALVQGNLVRDFVKWDDQPHNIASVPESFVRGYRVAAAEPQGPVYLCYDATLQAERLENLVPIPEPGHYAAASPIHADPDALATLAHWLVDAEFPLIIADYVGRDPRGLEALEELAELLAIPVIDKRGRYNFPTTHPMDVTGLDREVLAEADLVLGLDVKDLHGATRGRESATWKDFSLLRPDAKVASISLWDLRIRGWALDHQRLCPTDLNIAADTTHALPQLVELCKKLAGGRRSTKVQQRHDSVGARHNELRRRLREEAARRRSEQPIAPPWLAVEVWEAIKGEDWALTNGAIRGALGIPGTLPGTGPAHPGWARNIWEFNKPYHYMGGNGAGGLGYGICASVGAALGHKGTGRLCVDLQDDGDFLYTSNALWTAARYRIPLLVVMVNNRSYYNSENHAIDVANSRERDVERRGIGITIDDPNVDYAALARALGVHGEGPVESPGDIAPALQRAIRVVRDEGLPALVDVVTQRR